nr:fused MFS/spermidine synthase [Burkholderiales bacterium]
VVYIAFIALAGASALFGLRHGADSGAARDEPAPTEAPPKVSQRLAWFTFAALGSFLLLAITNHVCTNIASIPFLWVAPLSLYLLSFILCFDGRGWYRRRLNFLLTGALLIPMAGLLASATLTLDLKLIVPLYLAGLFISCMFCHGELALRKPSPTYLTGFYLMISLGGAVGALLVGVIAPHALPGYFELGFGLTAVALLLTSQLRREVLPYKVAGFIVTVAVAAAWVYQIEIYSAQTRLMARNFYGSLRTWDTTISGELIRKFVHGAILHGHQFLSAERSRQPTTYYAETSGVGRALTALNSSNRRIGVIGLGAGTLAVYGKAGDYLRVYEINPQVIDIALKEFTFIGMSPAKIDIVLGDARLNLEKEAAQRFDLLVIDAFSGDAIPVHLITREAVAVYHRHLQPGGVLAFHVTNRYLQLAPVVKQLADSYGLSSVLVGDEPLSTDKEIYSSTDWVLVSANKKFLQQETFQQAAKAIIDYPNRHPWTDDFNNLLQILK